MKQFTRTALACLLLLLAQNVYAQLSAPKLTPVPSTASQTAILREGVALHDKGNYDGAIAKYQQVLKENPDNVVAMYEMAYAYYAKKDSAKALETAYSAARYKSDSLGAIYVLIGNLLDIQGDSKKALEVYKAGLKLAPEDGGLHFNLAVTQRGTGKLEDARKSVKRAVVFSPEHKSSHLLLASLFHHGQYRTPSLLAVLRFLTLEPNTERSQAALQLAHEVLRGGVSAGKSPNEINIFLDMASKKDEGDFDSMNMMLGLTQAVTMTEKERDKPEAERLVGQVDTLLAILSEMDAKKLQSSFTGKYYVPYFVELKRRNYVEPFIYYTHQRSTIPGVKEWLQKNGARVDEFLSWSKKYRWPRVE